MKKLLMVCPYFYPEGGGLENYAYNIAKGLVKKGFKVTVLCSTKKGINKEEIIDGIKVLRYKPDFRVSNTPIILNWRKIVCGLIDKENPDVVNGHLPVPYIADVACRVAKRKGVRFVLTYHNDLDKEDILFNFISKMYYVFMGDKTLKMSDQIIATSKYYAENSPHLKKYLSKIEIVPPGVDTTRFNLKVDKKWLKKKYGLKKNKIVLFVGQMDKTHQHKGLNYLIESVALAKKKVPNIKLMAVGRGDYIEHYKELAKKSGIENDVIFPGFVSDKELPYYYAGSDVTVLCPYTNSEGFGMTLIESMACGTPVIGTRVGGISHILNNDGVNNILIEPRDNVGLQKAINILITNNSKKITTIDKNKFDWNVSINNSMKLFT